MMNALQKIFFGIERRQNAIVFCLVVGLHGFLFWRSAMLSAGVQRFTLDDGYYYFQIARNLAAGKGSTFDGITLTNGYQFLWTAALVPVFWVFPIQTDALLIIFIIQGGLMLGVSLLLYFTFRLQFPSWLALIAVWCWVWTTYPLFLSGMEFALQAMGIVTICFLYIRLFEPIPVRPRPYILLGVALALAFLTRLDILLLGWLVILVIAPRKLKQRAGQNHHLFLLLLPLLIVSVLYFVTNQMLFKYPVPISGAIKQDWSTFFLQSDSFFRSNGWLAAKFSQFLWPLRFLNRFTGFLFLGVIGTPLFWLFGTILSRLSASHTFVQIKQFTQPWSPFILFSGLHYTGYVILYHGWPGYAQWYYPMEVLVGILGLIGLINIFNLIGKQHRILGKFTHQGMQICFISAITFISVHLSTDLERWRPPANGGGLPIIEAVSQLPTGAMIGSWNGGALSFYSGKPILALDGLVNSSDYFTTEHFDLCEYWRKLGVVYLVDLFDHEPSGEPHPKYPGVPEYQMFADCQAHLKLIWADERFPNGAVRVEIYELIKTYGAP